MLRLAREFSEADKAGVMDAYMDAAREVCASNSVAVCDCYEIWMRMERNKVDTAALLCNDLNHPSRELAWLAASELVKTLLGGGGSD